jgi:hypothetical protein
VLYVLGAVVMEAWSGKVAEAAHDTDLPSNLAYCLIITVEESLEMVGLILCIHVMMRLLADRAVALTVDVVPDAEATAVPHGSSSLHRAQQA